MAGTLLVAVQRVLRSRAFRMFVLKAGPAVAASAMGLARHGQWRQLAILHADSLVGGRFSREVLEDGAVHWIVWQEDQPVTSYPDYEGPLEAALEGHDPANRRAPADLPSRRAREAGASSARRAGQRAGRLLRRGKPG